jgi:hypothetical protein
MREDDFIDELYQHSAREPNIPFNPEAWARMERKLAKAKRRLFWWRFTLFGFALAVVLGIWWLWNLENKSGPDMIILAKPTDIIASSSGRDAHKKRDTLFMPKPVKERLEAASEEVQGVTGTPFHVGLKLETTSDQMQGKEVALSAEILFNDTTLSEPAVINKTADRPGDSSATIISMSDKRTPAMLLPGSPNIKISVESLRPPQLPGISASFNSPPNIRQAKPSKWAVGLRISTAASSSSELNSEQRNGFGIGVTGEYKFAPRWAIRSDLMWSKKRYVAHKGEYIPPTGFWTRQIVPTEIEGDCNVAQWGLLLRFDYLRASKWKLYVAAGASSWWILDERYDYYYIEPDADLVQNWSTSKISAQLFNMGQIGLGGDYKLSSNLNIGVEVFAELPFSGIGHGNVHLFSKGVSLSIKRSVP